MKKVYLLTVFFLMLSLMVSASKAIFIADSVTGFSDTQGQNGWSYYGKHFSESDWSELTYDSPSSAWTRSESFGWIGINATSQTMLEGNALFTRRVWTSDADYSSAGGVIVKTEYDLVSNAGAGLFLYDASAGTETVLDFTWLAGSGVFEATIADFGIGDQIITHLQNSGDGLGSFTWQRMTTTIETVPEPATISMLLVGGLGYVFKRRK